MPTPSPIMELRMGAEVDTSSCVASSVMSAVPVARPNSAIPMGSPMPTTEPNVTRRMSTAARTPTISAAPVSGRCT